MDDALVGLDTPTLKGIWETGPYLHDGSAATLMDVITTANPGDRHGRTSHLSRKEREQLAAFLLQLDDGIPPVVGLEPSPLPPRLPALTLTLERLPGGTTRVRLQGGGFQAAPRVTLRNGSGSLIRAFPARVMTAFSSGDWTMDWNGLDGSGNRAAPGVFLLTGEAGGSKASVRVPWNP